MPKEHIRTRFAPSPTGYLHVGGLRTALYNYLFAKRKKGDFVLRIEDTDRTRFVEGAAENLINTLKWCGLDYSEGPDKEGSFAPYTQSERFDLYQKYVRDLLEKGEAYHCFCTQEDLDQMRQELEQKKMIPKYDGRCKKLTPEQVQEKLDQKIPYVIRMKIPENVDFTFKDIIRGNVTFNTNQIDDQILIKSDGFPTYHLASVVDDHLMKINYVIRGEEWLPSTVKHILLYRSFGWDEPDFAHLPLLLNPDRTKLSKRQGDVAVEDYQKKGYLPQAIINFIALLGWNPGDNREILSLEELISEFNLEKVNKAGAVFDIEKLNWMNAQYLKKLSEKELIDFTIPFLKKAGKDISDFDKISQMVLAVKNTLQKGEDIIEATNIFYQEQFEIQDQESKEIIVKENSKIVLNALKEKFASLSQLTKEIFFKTMKEISKETGIKKAELWMPVRVALTGVCHGPDIGDVIEVFGLRKCQNQLEHLL